MQLRTLGNSERELPAIGFGCMGLSEFYGAPMDEKAARFGGITITILVCNFSQGILGRGTQRWFPAICAGRLLLHRIFLFFLLSNA